MECDGASSLVTSFHVRLGLFRPLQVLASVKNQIEQVAARQKDFPELLLAAQQCLLARETSIPAQGSPLYLFFTSY